MKKERSSSSSVKKERSTSTPKKKKRSRPAAEDDDFVKPAAKPKRQRKATADKKQVKQLTWEQKVDRAIMSFKWWEVRHVLDGSCHGELRCASLVFVCVPRASGRYHSPKSTKMVLDGKVWSIAVSCSRMTMSPTA